MNGSDYTGTPSCDWLPKSVVEMSQLFYVTELVCFQRSNKIMEIMKKVSISKHLALSFLSSYLLQKVSKFQTKKNLDPIPEEDKHIYIVNPSYVVSALNLYYKKINAADVCASTKTAKNGPMAVTSAVQYVKFRQPF